MVPAQAGSYKWGEDLQLGRARRGLVPQFRMESPSQEGMTLLTKIVSDVTDDGTATQRNTTLQHNKADVQTEPLSQEVKINRISKKKTPTTPFKF